jgi:sarcosine oxidase subunit gamma
MNFKKAHGATLPAPTKLVKFDQGHIGWLGPDQYLAEIDTADEYIDQKVTEALEGSASVTLQSDAWVGLDISGDRISELLERLIALDTSESAFPAGSMARTQMHHLGVILLRYPDATTAYRLLSARSSAQYFLHAVVQTAQNICGDPL